MLARFVVSRAKMIKPKVTTITTLLSTIYAKALMGFVFPVALDAIAPITPRRTVAGTIDFAVQVSHSILPAGLTESE